MTMQMSGDGGVLSVPSDHVLGMVALVAAPLVAWVVISAVQNLAVRDVPWATRCAHRFGALSTAARAALVGSYIGAVVHLVLVQPHWTEDRTRAIAFIVDTVGFGVAFGWTCAQRPHWRAASLVMMAATVGGYAFYVLRGWEEVDLVGLVTTTIELAAALILVAPDTVATEVSRSRERWILGAAVPLALLSVLGTNAIAGATLDESPEAAAHAASHQSSSTQHQGQSMQNMPGMKNMPGMRNMPGMGTSRGQTHLTLATTSPAGPIAWPEDAAAMDMGPGMKMVTPNCTTPPTAAQQHAAVALVDQTVAAAARYRSLAAAKAAGYVPVTPSGLKIVHYINPDIYLQGSVLDPNSIPVLVYVNTPHGAVLSAAMYLMPFGSSTAKPPQPGGCLTQWHIHTNLCFASGGVVAISNTSGNCPAGSINKTTPPMMHVWLSKVPGGPLSPEPSDLSQLVAASQLPPLARPNGTA